VGNLGGAIYDELTWTRLKSKANQQINRGLSDKIVHTYEQFEVRLTQRLNQGMQP
jgi:hypothetical protein